jgi:hypothetical protein
MVSYSARGPRGQDLVLRGDNAMSRSGYSEVDDPTEFNLYRGNVDRTLAGKKGQRALLDMAAAMDAMPFKGLVSEELACEDGMCALGVLGAARGIDFSGHDPEDIERVARDLDVTPMLVAEVSFMNDEGDFSCAYESVGARWVRMRQWIGSKIKETT